jgi:hypothetical protein
MKNVWTPADVEAETLAGYDPLSAWNRAVVLGGTYYAEWRAAHIEPIERAHHEKYLDCGPYLRRRFIVDAPPGAGLRARFP